MRKNVRETEIMRNKLNARERSRGREKEGKRTRKTRAAETGTRDGYQRGSSMLHYSKG